MIELPNDSVTIAGIEIPSKSPVFLTIVGIHVAVALSAVITGLIAILSLKGSKKHLKFGKLYFWALSIVFVTAAILSIMRWIQDYYLFVIGFFSFSFALFGRISFKLRSKHKISYHITGMGISFTLMLIAFYLDNGKNLPIWNKLPVFAYWLIPTLVGVPLIVYSIFKYRGKKFTLSNK